jgi:leucyl aminopeptidase
MEHYLFDHFANDDQATCLILPVYGDDQLTHNGELFDQTYKAILATALQTGDLPREIGRTLWVRHTAQRVLLVYAGESTTLNQYDYLKTLNGALQALTASASTQAHCYLTDLTVEQADYAWQVRQIIFKLADATYRFQASKTLDKPESHLSQLGIFTPAMDLVDPRLVRQAAAMATGQQLAKELGNLPANICTPTYLANQAQQLAEQFEHLQVEVLDEHQMAAMGMNTLLAVSEGSDQPAKFIVAYYRPPQAKDSQPQVLVGKGVTFDAGGICLKPSKMMDEMKFDMCGAASVLGTLHAIATLQLPVHVIGVIAAVENLPSGKALKPGDVIKSMAGLTVEVNNTDAEGRLLLCDALHYVKQFNPKAVIDIATLTGAMIIMLGHHITGMMGNDQALADSLQQAGAQTHDPIWQLPLTQPYQEQLQSNFADLPNIASDPSAGSIVAAAFLSRFTQDYPWVHLDIAGTAWNSGKAKGATGRPVTALTQYLINTAQPV